MAPSRRPTRPRSHGRRAPAYCVPTLGYTRAKEAAESAGLSRPECRPRFSPHCFPHSNAHKRGWRMHLARCLLLIGLASVTMSTTHGALAGSIFDPPSDAAPAAPMATTPDYLPADADPYYSTPGG